MAKQATLSVGGGLAASIRTLVSEYPGVTLNRVGRALVRLGLRQALRERDMLVEELRQLDAPWPSPTERAGSGLTGRRGPPGLRGPHRTRKGEGA